MNDNFYGVIMAGGVGTRFWPLSRKKMPKQFLDILGTGETLFQGTYKRLARVCKPENIYIVTNENYREIINQQVPGLSEHQILGEPHARNTAPCVAYASFKINTLNKNAVISVLPSDQLITDEDLFAETLQKAYEYCTDHDNLLTLGIQPSRPDTGYGYIQIDEEKEENGIFKVKTFTEKPNQEIANYFVASGEFLWNSGMFVWNVRTIMNELHTQLPDIYQVFEKGKKHYFHPEEKEYIHKAYELCTSISIDYGVMEKAHNVYVLPSAFNWSDVGTWTALYEYSKKDDHGNVMQGDMVLLRNTSNCIINVPNKKLVALNSVQDLIVVESDGILLIADKNKEQEIRQVVNDIKIKYGEKFI
ncbi:MAG: mannose-1-phosphate guanylyltransferase [Sphingobacteriales bacterium]|nr:MAG: mannose-1-phosphate guanylyltransferase [Sphingobacteriales bacterium]